MAHPTLLMLLQTYLSNYMMTAFLELKLKTLKYPQTLFFPFFIHLGVTLFMHINISYINILYTFYKLIYYLTS